MAKSHASALRPLRAIELASFTGIEAPGSARISSGMIGAVPFELVVEPHTVQLHVLLGDSELMTYATFMDERPGVNPFELAQRIVDDINAGCWLPERLAELHSLVILEHHPGGRRGQLAETDPPPRLGGRLH